MICNLDKLKPTSPSWAIGSKDELLSSVKLWLLLLNRNSNNEVRLLDLRLAVLAAVCVLSRTVRPGRYTG